MDEPPQATWKRVRPVLLATLVPVVAALGFFALATYGKRRARHADQPSMAAFDACLTEHGLQPAENYPSQFDATVAAQQQMKACGDKIPKKVLEKAAGRAARREVVVPRVHPATFRRLAVRGGFGRFRGGPSQSFRDAFSICRSLLENSGRRARRPRAPKTTGPGPVA